MTKVLLVLLLVFLLILIVLGFMVRALLKTQQKDKQEIDNLTEQLKEARDENNRLVTLQRMFDKAQRDAETKADAISRDLHDGTSTPADVLSELSEKSKNRVRSGNKRS